MLNVGFSLVALLATLGGEDEKDTPRYLAKALAASDSFTVTLYDKVGRPTRELVMTRDSKTDQQLRDWMRSLKRKGITLKTWIPQMVISSDRIIVQFSGQRLFLIVLDEHGASSHQYSYDYDKAAEKMRSTLEAEVAKLGHEVEQ